MKRSQKGYNRIFLPTAILFIWVVSACSIFDGDEWKEKRFEVAYRNLTDQKLVISFYDGYIPYDSTQTMFLKQTVLEASDTGLTCVYYIPIFADYYIDCQDRTIYSSIQFMDSVGYFFNDTAYRANVSDTTYHLKNRSNLIDVGFEIDEDGIYYFDITQLDYENALRLPDSLILPLP
jgi:hypothetical protein